MKVKVSGDPVKVALHKEFQRLLHLFESWDVSKKKDRRQHIYEVFLFPLLRSFRVCGSCSTGNLRALCAARNSGEESSGISRGAESSVSSSKSSRYCYASLNAFNRSQHVPTTELLATSSACAEQPCSTAEPDAASAEVDFASFPAEKRSRVVSDVPEARDASDVQTGSLLSPAKPKTKAARTRAKKAKEHPSEQSTGVPSVQVRVLGSSEPLFIDLHQFASTCLHRFLTFVESR